MVAALIEIDANHMVQRAHGSQRACLKTPMIVAHVRKLLVALWKYVSFSVVIEGTVMKNA